MTKRRNNKKNKAFWQKPTTLFIGLGVIGLVVLGIWIISTDNDNSPDESSLPTSEQEAIQMPHIHGLSFSADGSRLIVPAHIGLAIFEDERWSFPDIPAHDYMGYSGTNDGFFSSGHPDIQSNLINPLGLVKSTDGGQNVTVLDFMGETDFHLMAAGYQNHAVYVLNPQPNSKLTAGLHYTLDEGETWQQSQAQGLEGGLSALAVHPIDANQVAIATEAGLFFSDDYGSTFRKISVEDQPVTAVSFHPGDPTLLYFATTSLSQYNLANAQIENIDSPPLTTGDFIQYIALNPVDNTIGIATFGRDIFLSKDDGQNWQQIVNDGTGLNS